jgi:hydroxymethylpyrimidine pyrophosphatase-like HAD family hydrolase
VTPGDPPGGAREPAAPGGGLRLARPVKVFACDVDGCLAAAGHADYDLGALARVAELNRLSASDPSVPALTFVTGRPHAYVDALSQALAVRLPMSFENGAGLATRHPYGYWLDERVELGLSALRQFAAAVEETDHLTLQPGKVASLSVFPRPAGRDVHELAAELARMMERLGLRLALDPSTDCVNVLVPGVDKATGFAWLCRELGLGPEEVAGVGDSVGDVEWLRACGASFAPANAVDEVKRSVGAVSALPDVGAVVEAYEALVAANRRLLEG